MAHATHHNNATLPHTRCAALHHTTVCGILGWGVEWTAIDKGEGNLPKPQPGIVECQTDAKLCPDGSAVGRVGPDCEFAACPNVQAGSDALGTDMDGDGLWDDVQTWIMDTFPDQPNVQAGLRQYALPLQQALLDADSEELALEHANAMDRAQDCLEAIVGLIPSQEYTDLLHAHMLNTRERSLAYIEYDSQLGGHFFTIPAQVTLDLCDFEVK